ncbi:glycosyltransferase family 2 protein, partial [Cohnella sp.]|uniref:glycosyltransferase family 2 protein n=1 Tax=Cohnella sp. TaxID=1883426 RepID=UPI00356AE428
MTSGKKENLVSVVIPIYNGQRYIEETVRKVLDQTYSEIEIICIIDGTNDESGSILRRFGDPRIEILEQENRGATYTRNRGLSLAKGEFILFLDQDDVIHPEFIERTVREIVRTGSTGVAVNGHLIDAQGRRIRRMYRIHKPKLTLRSLLKGNQMYTSSQVLLRRDKLAKIGSFDVQADQADDWDMWIRHARNGKLTFLDLDLIGYRMHDANQSLNVDKMLRSELHIVERKLADADNPQEIKSYTYMRYSTRAGDWNALAKAVRLNSSLVL